MFLPMGETCMKILVDEMYAGLKEYFEILGWETLTVQDINLKGAKDKTIVEYAKSNNLLLVAQDQKQAEMAELVGVKYVLISNAMIAKIADSQIKEKYPELAKFKGESFHLAFKHVLITLYFNKRFLFFE